MLPTGTILLWHGAIIDIPFGFVLCDGTHGTPDLRNRFVVGAGDTYDPGDAGGSATHTHPFTSDGHFHALFAGPNVDAGDDYETDTSTETVTGVTDAGSSLPPYYALAFIMKT